MVDKGCFQVKQDLKFLIVRPDQSVQVVYILDIFLIRIYCQLAICTSYFQKLKKFPYPCWDLNPPPQLLAYEARTIPQDHQGRLV